MSLRSEAAVYDRWLEPALPSVQELVRKLMAFFDNNGGSVGLVPPYSAAGFADDAYTVSGLKDVPVPNAPGGFRDFMVDVKVSPDGHMDLEVYPDDDVPVGSQFEFQVPVSEWVDIEGVSFEQIERLWTDIGFVARA